MVGHYLGFALGANRHLLKGLGQVLVGDRLLATACGDNCCFVGHVCEVGATTTGCLGGELVEVDRRVSWLVLKVHLKDCLTVFALGQANRRMAVEAAWAQQRWVEHIGSVGCR